MEAYASAGDLLSCCCSAVGTKSSRFPCSLVMGFLAQVRNTATQHHVACWGRARGSPTPPGAAKQSKLNVLVEDDRKIHFLLEASSNPQAL